jgi:choline dehydrogenase-like flavoprotein
MTSELERWSLPTNFGKEYRSLLRSSTGVKLYYNLTCTEILCRATGRVDSITAKTLAGKTVHIHGSRYVIACGGLETTRLLMASDRLQTGGIGNHSDMLGRYYMGHISGRIARVCFTTPPEKTVYGFDRDPDGVYLRRRFTFSRDYHHEKRLPNAAAWLVNPDIHDPTHRNGILSFAYLMLTSPVIGKRLASDAIRRAATGNAATRNLAGHMLNMLTDLPRTLAFIASFGTGRFLARRKVPGFFVYSKTNIYPLHYFCEHLPDPDSHVTLSAECDEVGMRRLDIDLRYSDADVDNVLRAHEYWDIYLRRHGCGHLEFMEGNIRDSIFAQIEDGYHQIGTTRMSDDPGRGVVDRNCRIHGFENIYVASSSTFVTSGQANSTFTIIAFALRLADHLRQLQTGDGH